jgi:hypothetical protein
MNQWNDGIHEVQYDHQVPTILMPMVTNRDSLMLHLQCHQNDSLVMIVALHHTITITVTHTHQTRSVNDQQAKPKQPSQWAVVPGDV